MFVATKAHAQWALNRLKAGERIITNDQTLDAIEEHFGDDPAIDRIASLFNPRQMGTLDQYIAWIKE